MVLTKLKSYEVVYKEGGSGCEPEPEEGTDKQYNQAVVTHQISAESGAQSF
jgi:hypothetical protein